MTSPEDPTAESSSEPKEPLACVSCRARKLKCDRALQVCGRCAKLKQECVYPESRRKPTFKKRNVRELEARLAQVEDLLKDGGSKIGSNATLLHDIADDACDDSSPLEEDQDDPAGLNFEFGDVGIAFNDTTTTGLGGVDTGEDDYSQTMPGIQVGGGDPMDTDLPPDFLSQDLISLGGLYETLPPQRVMEELHKHYFQRQHNFIPIIHPTHYLKSFYSAPHMKPPMCLQYAVWSVASNGHEKYHSYHDVFYQRARKYAEADELRGHGEYFITLQHAQTWALIAVDEARSMYFTRASMSSAKCTKLVHMMGLHRMDSGPDQMSPTLAPPRNWAEREERRRTLWGAFCIDSHGSIATGWPTLHDWTEISTHLPASEEAFNSEQEAEACTLPDAFTGSPYGAFAGAVVICHLFNRILRHVHRKRPDERPDDLDYGGYWKRHRELDNLLSSAFMHLPDEFRLPKNLKNPAAVHTNLNLHASIICLHHAALERIETHKLPERIREMSLTRMKTAAAEIVNVMRLTSHHHPEYRSPLVALSLYCAASVHIFQAKEAFTPTPTSPPPSHSSSANGQAQPAAAAPQFDFSNLEFLLLIMETIGRDHTITTAFLRQALTDIERNNLLGPARAAGMRIPQRDPDLDHPPATTTGTSSGTETIGANIPLLARSSVSKHSSIQPPLPGRLPLNAPIGEKPSVSPAAKLRGLQLCGFATVTPPNDDGDDDVVHHGQIHQQQQQATTVVSERDDEGNKQTSTSGATGSKRRRLQQDFPPPSTSSSTNTNGFIFTNPSPSTALNGLSRIEHLFRVSAASKTNPTPFITPADISTLLPPSPFPSSSSSLSLSSAASSASAALLTRPTSTPTPTTSSSPSPPSLPHIRRGPVHQQAPQPKHILSGPTPLPFRRAMQPVAGQCRLNNTPGPGKKHASSPSQNANYSPFGIVAPSVIDVDLVLRTMGHGTVVSSTSTTSTSTSTMVGGEENNINNHNNNHVNFGGNGLASVSVTDDDLMRNNPTGIHHPNNGNVHAVGGNVSTAAPANRGEAGVGGKMNAYSSTTSTSTSTMPSRRQEEIIYPVPPVPDDHLRACWNGMESLLGNDFSMSMTDMGGDNTNNNNNNNNVTGGGHHILSGNNSTCPPVHGVGGDVGVGVGVGGANNNTAIIQDDPWGGMLDVADHGADMWSVGLGDI